ncbi:hypothetical protein EV421DRAFT_1889159 [Armillaria borealis]|uniref:Uncharacterized protein n=1 Tax=Armillaria borealis TaxID=47425 RepID=A0AA39MX17_9AGAR|nr:hypothetical protein EV421DRAFT_1889159 [Armillaria borealis]
MAGFSDSTYPEIVPHSPLIFTPDTLANFYLELHDDYHDALDVLCDSNWDLCRNFIECVWAAMTINFGPMACTDRHTDFLNLVQGMCAIWALGNFDEKKGSHLVLWDLKLIIEFPAGSCILLPSVLLKHSNLPIHKGESRCSFVMYSVAGLFRWVENGMWSNVDILTNGGEDARKAWMDQRAALPAHNVPSFPLWEELKRQCLLQLRGARA